MQGNSNSYNESCVLSALRNRLLLVPISERNENAHPMLYASFNSGNYINKTHFQQIRSHRPVLSSTVFV